MKKIAIIAVAIVFVFTGLAMAQSNVKGAVINTSNVKDSANVSVGVDNKANLGTTRIESSNVKGAVINTSNVKGSANVAAGVGNTANMGSVDLKIQRSNVQGCGDQHQSNVARTAPTWPPARATPPTWAPPRSRAPMSRAR